MMGKKDNFGANFLDVWIIKDKITGFCECKAVYASIYSSFNSFKKCLLFKLPKPCPTSWIFKILPPDIWEQIGKYLPLAARRCQSRPGCLCGWHRIRRRLHRRHTIIAVSISSSTANCFYF